MIQTEQTVITPYGSFVAMWDENEDMAVMYRGDQDALAYFKAYLDINVVSGRNGAVLTLDTLEPADLYGFCQSREFGIAVLQEPEDLFRDSDAPGDEGEPDMSGQGSPAGSAPSAPVLDAVGTPAKAKTSILPMAASLKEIINAAREYAMSHFAGRTVKNASDGSSIVLSRKGIKHTLSANAGLVNALMMTDLENLVRNGKFERQEAPKASKPNVVAVYRYSGSIDIDGQVIAVGFVVEELNDHRRYYHSYILKDNYIPNQNKNPA